MSKPDIVDWLSAQWDHGHSINQQERCRDARDEILELRALALSLAETLEGLSKTTRFMVNPPDSNPLRKRLDEADAALSSPALLKLKGGA